MSVNRGKRRVRSGGARVVLASLEPRVMLSTTYYVDPAGTNQGTSWAGAFILFQSALQFAHSGDTIRVAQGTYKPTTTADRTISFALASGLTIQGGYAGNAAPSGTSPDARSTSETPTILAGTVNPNGQSYHVVTAIGITGTTLDGIRIENGNAVGTGANQNVGGGIFVDASALTLSNCEFSADYADSSSGGGGGAYIGAGSAVQILGCDFGGCNGANGGAVEVLAPTTIRNTFFTNNAAVTGGALYISSGLASATLVSGCTFYFNLGSYGGAIANYGSSHAQVVNSLFSANRVDHNGGAIDNAFSANLEIAYSTFTLNTTSYQVATAGVGGAIDNYQSSLAVVDSVLYADTTASGVSEIYNWAGTTPASTVSASYSLIAGSGAAGVNYTGAHLIDGDPKFVRGATHTPLVNDPGDLRLSLGSPALNAGTATTFGLTVTSDYAGAARVQENAPDMGAYEGGVDVTPPVSHITVEPAATNQPSFVVAWSGTDNAGGSGVASYTLYMSDNGGPLVATLSDSTATSYFFSGGVNGHTYGFLVQAKDVAGNAELKAAVAERTTVVDIVAPTASLVTPSLNVNVNHNTFGLAWGGTDNVGGSGIATYTVTVNVDGSPGTNVVAGTTATSATFTGTPGHTYSFICNATDNAGNFSNNGFYQENVFVDLTAPTSSALALPPTSDDSFTVAWQGSETEDFAEAGNTYDVLVSTDGGAYAPFLSGTPASSATFNGARGHRYAFYTVATDGAGNVEVKTPPPTATGEAFTFTDETPPTSAVAALPAYLNTATIPLLWSGTDDVNGAHGTGIATYTIYVSDDFGAYVPLLTDTVATSAVYTGVEGHRYQFYSAATDVAGNVESDSSHVASTTLDLTAPTSTAYAPDESTSTNFPISWSGDDSLSGIATYSIFVSDNGGAFAPFLTNTTSTSATFTGAAGHTYGFYSVATDVAGNVEVKMAAEATTAVALAAAPDTVAPTSSLGSLPATSSLTQFVLTATGSDDTGGSGIHNFLFYVSDNGGALALYRSVGVNGNTAATALYTGVAGHTYGFLVRAMDYAGNLESKPAVEATITLLAGAAPDTTAPTSAVAALPATTTTTSFNVSWSGSDDAGGVGISTYSVFVSDNGGAFTTFRTGTPGTSGTFAGVDGHTYAFYSVARDRAGNVESKGAVAEATTTINTDVPSLTELGSSGTAGNLVLAASPALKLPKPVNGAIVGGSVLKGSVKVKNAGTALVSGPLKVSFYLSSDGTVSTKDAFVATVTAKSPAKLKPGATVAVPYTITLPSNYAGSARLLAYVNPPVGGAMAIAEHTTLDDVASLGQLTLAEPALNLTAGTLVAKGAKLKKGNTATFTVTNNSNVAFAGTLPFSVDLLDSGGASVGHSTLSKVLNIAAGKSAKVTLSFAGPATAGAYSLRATFDPAHTFSQTRVEDDTATTSLGTISK